MHAHNAWLDGWLQVSILGLIIFALLVQSLTETRSLVEGEWLLLVFFAVRAKISYLRPAQNKVLYSVWVTTH